MGCGKGTAPSMRATLTSTPVSRSSSTRRSRLQKPASGSICRPIDQQGRRAAELSEGINGAGVQQCRPNAAARVQGAMKEPCSGP